MFSAVMTLQHIFIFVAYPFVSDLPDISLSYFSGLQLKVHSSISHTLRLNSPDNATNLTDS